MASKKPAGSLSETRTVVTAETITDVASQVELGEISVPMAMTINLCVATERAKHINIISNLKASNSIMCEKYKGVLRELRDKLRCIRFDDLLKVIIGITGGLVVNNLRLQGISALKDPWVAWAALFFIICLVFIIISHLGPSKRKNEIKNELIKLEDESQE